MYGAKIIVKLLKYIDPKIPFKKDDLISLNLPDFQVMDYIWTLQELNLISEDNSSDNYSLKDKATLNEFVAKWKDPESTYIPSEDEENFIIKRCPYCGAEVKDDFKFCKQDNTKLQEKNASENKTIKKEQPIIKLKPCEYCGEKINTKAEICPECGVRLKKAELEKNPGIALILSLIIPGFGQLYNNQIHKGFCFIVLFIISIILIIYIIGVFLGLIIWIYAIYDAYNTSKALNNGEIIEDKIWVSSKK